MINVNLVGNPNTGKTTLFNNLTSSNEHVGNWHGVTVEAKNKIYKYKNYDINLVDLPGIYSLTALSYEEDVSCEYIKKYKDRVFVNICDASNLQRNLYLTLGLLELGCKVILVVNQIDKRPICKIDFKKLSKLLNVKIVYLSASDKKNLCELNDAIIEVYSYKKESYILPYIKDIDFSLLEQNINLFNKDLTIFEKIKILEDDEKIKKLYSVNKIFNQIDKIASLRYKFIDEILSKTVSKRLKVYGESKLDKILLNKFLALPIFILFISLSFYITFFSLGAFLSNGLEFLMTKYFETPITNFLISQFGELSWIVSFFKYAIFEGVGAVLTFLPQVGLLFFFLSILEDSGYLARVAFVFEDILSKCGLSGKSVYTLLMGFGCSTTAVLTARNMDDKNAKIKTGLLTPYMSCSAKFPIYSVLGGVFFGVNNIFVILFIYLISIVVAVLMSYIFDKFWLKSKKQSFILEFPEYRFMSFKRVFSILALNIKQFIFRVGTLIISMNIIVWFLANFSFKFQFIKDENGVSILESLGKILSPIFTPLGFSSWGLVSALIAGLVAKEVVVSSILMFSGGVSLDLTLMQSGSPVYFASGASLLSYLVFCLLYFPCLATIAVLDKEIGFKWTFLGCILQFVVAYIISMFIYVFTRCCEVYGLVKILIISIVGLMLILSILYIIKSFKKKKCFYCNNACKKKNFK